jgi:PAS domain S-box-containing protein
MHIETHAGILELRAALRDLVAISTIPAAWVGREPPAIAAGLADVLLESLGLDFAFVRLCDPNGGSEVEVTRGNGWSGFPKWLSDHFVKGAFSCKEIVPDIGRGAQPCRGVVIPIGVNAEAGLAAAACGRADFPNEIDQLLLSVAANHAAAAFQDARLRNELDAKAAELRQARDNLEMKVAERTADLRRSEAYLAEAQRVSHTGSFGWSVSSGQIYWSDETFRILEWDQAHKPTVEFVLQRTHPEDRAFVEETLDCVARDRKAFDFEHRLLMPDGSVKFVRFVGHPSMDVESGSFDFVGAVTDITQSKRAEESLRRSEKELREVIETIPAMAFTRLPDGSGTFVNRRWTEYSGLSLEQTLGSHWQATIHPEDTDTHLNKWRASLSSGQPFENEVRHRSANGEYRWFLVRAVPLRDEHGNVLKWYGILTDIEDRKRAEAFLTGEKRILEMVAKGDSLPQILDSLCLFVEEQASRVLASILLVDGNRLRHGGAPSLPKAYTNAIDGGVIGPSVGSCGTAAYRGEQVIVEDIATDPLWADYREAALPHSLRACWSTPVFSSQGKVIATFAMYYREPRSPSPRDQETIEQITYLAGVAIERKLTQEVLRRSEAYLAEAQRMTHTGSWAWNVRTDALFWSEELLRIYDYDPEKMTASWDFFERVHPEDRPEIERRKKMESTQKEWAVSEIDFRIVLPDGTIKHLHSIAHPVMDESGEITEVVGTVMDVTERKRAEEERERLRQLEADLAHVNRVSMLGELAASLSHELKQPIAAAITNADTCLRWLRCDQPDIERASKAVTRIVRDGKRAAEIIDRLRSFYKQGAPAERELVDVNEVIREMLVLLRSEANRYSIPMRTDLAADLPRVSADRVPLQQVFLNLMLNGIEAMKDSGGELTIKSQLGNDGQLLISMSDNGVGLPSEKADQIFNAFFTTKPQGSGMGLAISRSIVESHGGRLWATANAGGGATFHFTLPTAAEVVKECATGT